MKLLLLFLFFVGANAYCVTTYGTIDENGHLDIIPAAAGGQPDNNRLGVCVVQYVYQF